MKTLSIVIVNLNTIDLTLKCIKSIKDTISKIDFEVILIDNGSDDNSPSELTKLVNEKYWKDYLTVIYNEKNVGYAKANNQGIKLAKGNYVLLLNNDTIVHKNSLQKLLEFARKTPSAGVVGAKLLNKDGTVQESCFYFPTISRAISEYFFDKKGYFSKYAPSAKSPVTVDALVGAAFLITPAALKKVGLLDERYFAYFEDTDYCRRVWKNGLKVYYLPDSVITHYHGATFEKIDKKDYELRWRRLIPSSKIYHGIIGHYILTFVLKVGQRFRKLFK